MDHIFGTSHDIRFGAPGAKPAEPAIPVETVDNRSFSHDDFSDLDGAPVRPASPKRPNPIASSRAQGEKKSFGHSSLPAKSQTERPQRRETQPIVDQKPVLPLTRLVESMKSSFLPKEDDTSKTRLVVLSGEGHTDPLMLVSRGDTTILIGTGFSTVTRAGEEYPTFPDMRLPVSEASRLAAWILIDPRIRPELFQTILPALGFPPLYTTRDIIANFRNSITDTELLSKCRFFELFADGAESRRIGDMEFRMAGGLTLKTPATEVNFAHLSSGNQADTKAFQITADGYSLFGNTILSGEIITPLRDTIEKHSMRFTFDTFYLDKSSVGVVAGYTLADRAQLAENGVLMFTLEEDMRARTIAGHIFIDSRGFVHAHEMMYVHKEILKGIRATYEKLLTENPKLERGTLVQGLRREITKYCYLLTGRTPVVMPIVIER